MKTIARFLALLAALLPLVTAAAESTAASDRVAWFREARYGMFIHWGVYSVPAGSYRGEPVDQGYHGENINPLGEWIMHAAKIPVAEYAAFAPQFNPVHFDADAWVRLAKDAGMKYIVITSKHHDGFAMFKSAASSFNIVDATPFKRDPLKELAAACAKHGIRLGFYYSQAQDWHHAGGAAYPRKGPHFGGNPALGHWDPAQDGSFDDYIDRIAVPQVRELLSNYGPVSILWWDTPVGIELKHAEKLAEVLKLQPQIVTNNRLYNPQQLEHFAGDTSTPEQQIPATGLGDRLFEVCMTMNNTWGYKAQDQNWKPASDITRKLIDIASKGGNFLLNVGPNSLGEIPAPSVERLRESGAWVRANSEAIHGTTASLFRRLPWGRSTTRGHTLYLHVFDWPTGGTLFVPGLLSTPQRAELLVSHRKLAAQAGAEGLTLTVPAAAPDAVATVIKLEFAAAPKVVDLLPQPDAQGVIELPASLAAIVNAYASNARMLGAGADAHIGAWTHPGTTVNWEFRTAGAGQFKVEAELALAAPATLRCECDGKRAEVKLEATGGLETYRTVTLGTVNVTAAGDHTLNLVSAKPWSEARLRRVRLVSAKW
ncbi:alpha-L-fucosidase [Opitutus sp. ER46]|uniref:alpha-L-fucosidase n=1 Tax=Opitutus sp. ER46 TaxID=2161864 RepID=UPI000D3001F4|nr:alpha-L-fucosidase [Opitutus sp. ER46]PTX98394.1 hypothetical protein DB354_03755 [Opitutus sp. ER46]